MMILKMKNKLRKLAAGLMTVSSLFVFSTLFSMHAYAGDWRFDGANWKYFDSDKDFRFSEWFLDEDGCWYYLDSNGNLLTDAVTPDGYTVGKDGAWIVKIPQVQRYTRVIPDETCNNYAGKKGEPIFQVDTAKPLVALSFDSGSSFAYTDRILDTLKKYNLRSTFFLTKEWMDSHKEDVQKIFVQGHEIGNHSVDHPDFTKLTASQMSVQLQSTHEKIKELTGREAFLFRAPFGAYNNAVVDSVKNNGYYCVQWSIDSLDWKNLGVQPILDRVLHSGKLKNGAIILMHNGAEYTPDALETIIQGILEQGYQIVPVSELIYTRNYQIDGMGIQHPTT